jgi:F-type H+-transporting ATPase subunit epsilon
MNRLDEDGGGTDRVIVSGGYAEIDDNVVIILADHARAIDDIEPDVVRETREAASMSSIPFPMMILGVPTTMARLNGVILLLKYSTAQDEVES